MSGEDDNAGTKNTIAEAVAEAPSTAKSEAAAERGSMLARAGIVGAGTLASRVLGLGRDMALAAIFTRDETDAFFVAWTIPNALRQLLAEGAISSAVVPLLSGKLSTDGDDAAKRFFARARGTSLVALVVATILGIVLARPLCELFAGGYHARPEEFERTVSLTRTVFPYIFFMGAAALGMAALNAKRKFAVAAFAPGLLNVAFLAAAFGLPPVLAARGVDRAQALAIGALAGGLLQVVAQWPALRAIGYAMRPVFDFRDPDVRKIFTRIAPLTIGIGIYYIDLILSRRFLSELGPGAQSYFTWAMRVCDFPQGIFVMALATASLPSLSALAARGDLDELSKTYAQGMRLALFVAIPASAALVALAEPLTVALFQRGEFDAVAARETARALAWQGAGIFTVAAVRQLVPVFHALGDTRTPVVVSGLDLVVFIALATTLRGPLGHAGVSIAVSGSSAAQMILLFIGLRRRLPSMRWREVAVSVSRTLVGAIVAGVGGWGAARLLSGESGGGGMARALPGVVGGLVFVALFLFAAWGVRAPELDAILGGFARRLRRR
jgi:putative peptidoglycan lipid II flippase